GGQHEARFVQQHEGHLAAEAVPDDAREFVIEPSGYLLVVAFARLALGLLAGPAQSSPCSTSWTACRTSFNNAGPSSSCLTNWVFTALVPDQTLALLDLRKSVGTTGAITCWGT